jgi:hypothetical protein
LTIVALFDILCYRSKEWQNVQFVTPGKGSGCAKSQTPLFAAYAARKPGKKKPAPDAPKRPVTIIIEVLKTD